MVYSVYKNSSSCIWEKRDEEIDEKIEDETKRDRQGIRKDRKNR